MDTDPDPKPKPRLRRYSPPPDDGSQRFDDRELLDELDCPVYTGDYAPLLMQTSSSGAPHILSGGATSTTSCTTAS